MNGYTEITSQAEMDAFLDRVDIDGFHDSLAKELHLFNRSWIGEDRGARYPLGADLRVLIQSQFDVHAVELLFIDLLKLSIGGVDEYGGASGWMKSESGLMGRQWVEVSFDGGLKISAKRMFYRHRPGWFGVEPRFGLEMPTPTCVEGTWIDKNWLQCKSCADAVEIHDQEYVRCPGCGSVIEVPREQREE